MEYKVIEVDYESYQRIEDILNKYGKENWDMVSIIPAMNGYRYNVFFKRPLQGLV